MKDDLMQHGSSYKYVASILGHPVYFCEVGSKEFFSFLVWLVIFCFCFCFLFFIFVFVFVFLFCFVFCGVAHVPVEYEVIFKMSIWPINATLTSTTTLTADRVVKYLNGGGVCKVAFKIEYMYLAYSYTTGWMTRSILKRNKVGFNSDCSFS